MKFLVGISIACFLALSGCVTSKTSRETSVGTHEPKRIAEYPWGMGWVECVPSTKGDLTFLRISVVTPPGENVTSELDWMAYLLWRQSGVFVVDDLPFEPIACGNFQFPVGEWGLPPTFVLANPSGMFSQSDCNVWVMTLPGMLTTSPQGKHSIFYPFRLRESSMYPSHGLVWLNSPSS